MSTVLQSENRTGNKSVKKSEFILYLIAVFFYNNMTGMMGSYRNAYLVNVLKLTEGQASLLNTLSSVIPFFLTFLIVMYIDGRKPGKKGKFKPIMMLTAIPAGLVLMMGFWTPSVLTGTFMMIYLVSVSIMWSVVTTFGNSINMIANVMTSDMKERDTVLSFRSISSVIYPGLKITGISSVKSTIVDSKPIPTRPPSRIMSILPFISSYTYFPSVGLGRPEVLALGAAT